MCEYGKTCSLLYLFQDDRFSKALSAYNALHQTDIMCLKPLQEMALSALTNGSDCICCLPTGFGKSLIYEILPFVDPKSLIIVVVPLNAIIVQQVKKLGSITIVLSKKANIPIKDVSDGCAKLISHPEDILNNRKVIHFFGLPIIKGLNKYLVIDEAHCILDWELQRYCKTKRYDPVSRLLVAFYDSY